MKQVQIGKVLEELEVDGAVSSTGVKVSDFGPETVAIQLLISDSDSPTAAEAQLEGSLDDENYFPIGEPVDVTEDGALCLKDTAVAFAWYRVTFAIDSGSFTATPHIFVYGNSV